MNERYFKVALFDLDGVVFDTEPQYTIFWRQEGRRYHPEIVDLEFRIKGQTLTQIYDGFFADVKDEQPLITQRLDEYEQNMQYLYVAGIKDFILQLRKENIKTAIVTSSNMPKMRKVYHQHPELQLLFDAVFTSEDFRESKPSPDCYLSAMHRLEVKPEECVIFEDSFNGLKSGRASGAAVVALSTSNAEETLQPLSDRVISDFTTFTVADAIKLTHSK